MPPEESGRGFSPPLPEEPGRGVRSLPEEPGWETEPPERTGSRYTRMLTSRDKPWELFTSGGSVAVPVTVSTYAPCSEGS